MYTGGTLNTVQGQGHLKAQGLLTASREPRHRAEPVTLPPKRTVQTETILSTTPTHPAERKCSSFLQEGWKTYMHCR